MQNKIKLIAAVSSNGVIGNEGGLVFQDKEDMKHFRETTTGNTVVMGRKTWDSIPTAYRPFKNRENVVISRNKDIFDCELVMTFEPEKDITKPQLENIAEYYNTDVFIIGGGEIYKQTINLADELIISEFPQEITGDTFFPEIDLNIWKLAKFTPFTNFILKVYERK